MKMIKTKFYKDKPHIAQRKQKQNQNIFLVINLMMIKNKFH
jgi:hypothetical protein